ncbi:DUF402 domain-containing protein [Sporosarcina sp. D27]|uniref:DUF402 domain-containing protein n=1 Tax=Sporosarcina sp. D27 TaxID=1382305 RepID=UPI00047262B7|nr:DUF402 domain-containing protein [Sporosarcina sp. D27]
MLKRKYGDRSEWKRVLNRKYAQAYLETSQFKGYITLLNTIKVTEPLSVKYEEETLCFVDDGYMWLQQFPLDENHSVTTMFDANGKVVQWYVDICLKNGLDDDVPWLDDLFLDIVILPSGEMFLKDEDELHEAFVDGIIDKSLYDLAWKEANHLTQAIINKTFTLPNLSNTHKQILVDKLE